MLGKIALEEHVAIDVTVEQSAGFASPGCWRELRRRLLDTHELRLREMDANGIEWMVVSLNSPTVQAIADPVRAAELARVANDALAELVARQPDRFRAFGALPMIEADSAIAELQRCITQLGFLGVMVNGFSEAGDGSALRYYDLPAYRPFWHALERLGVPFYLHPRLPLRRDARAYEGHAWLYSPAWAFGQETATHALRLMASGLFEECPDLQVILGHLGEGLPACLWRLDHATDWMWRDGEPRHAARRGFTATMRRNFHVTTSGNLSTPVLRMVIEILGADRIMFSTDWPFEEIAAAAHWFDASPLDEDTRRRIGRDNAQALLRLP